MNFYKHHLGDYAKDTAHLSLMEHGAYRRMLDVYYSAEKALPIEVAKILRLIGARSKEEKECVTVILDEFFELEEDGWHNKRCDEELGKYGAQAETNRRIAAEREARKLERERERIVRESQTNRVTNRSNNNNESLNEPLNESYNEVDQDRQPSQKPEARSQEKDKPPIPLSGGNGTANGHDLLGDGSTPKRPKRPAKHALTEGWYPSDTTIAWLNEFLAGNGLSEDWGQRQHNLFIGKAKANAWVYANWDQAYRNFMTENGPGGRFWKAPQ